MKRFLLAVMTVLAVAVPLAHADPVVGHLYDGYFTYRGDGLFDYQGATYSRYLVSNPGYYSYGYYYPGSSYYKYTRVYNQSYSTPPAYSANWKSELFKYAQQRDDAELYWQSLKALGFNGQTYSFQQYAGLGSYGLPQGATQYGYSVNTVRDVYGLNVDLNKLAQMSGQLTQGAQAAAAQANSETNGVVNELGRNAARVAEILAKGQAASQALAASNAQPSATTSTTVTNNSVSASAGVATGAPAFNANAVGDVRAFVANVITPQCGSCHGATDPKGGLNLLNWEKLGPGVHDKVLARLTTLDPEKKMPRKPTGEASSISKEEFIQFVRFHQ